jgi:hypothetical protein
VDIPYSDSFLLFYLFVYSINKQQKKTNVKESLPTTIIMAAMPLAPRPHLLIRKPIFRNKLGLKHFNPTKLGGQVISWRTRLAKHFGILDWLFHCRPLPVSLNF